MQNFNLHKYQLPPQNYLAEEILLGIIIIYPNMICHILPLVKSEYFFLEYHQILYENLSEIHKKNKSNVTEFLSNLIETKMLHKVGGVNKILDLIKQSQVFIITSYNINSYIEEIIYIIQHNYIKRLMIQYGYYIIQLAYIPKMSHHKLYNKASSYLNFIETKIPKNNISTVPNLITELLLKIQLKNSNDENDYSSIREIYIQSGINELDQLTSGLMKGDLIVIAGRPGMGKTSLAINIAFNVLNEKIGVCIFSLEMSNKQIINKLIAICSHVETKNLVLNKLKFNEWERVVKACNQLLKNNIYIYDNSNISIDYIEYTSKILTKDNPSIELIIIDYLQLIQVNIINNTNRTQELSYITRKLKLLAQYLNIPILILSQLNRSIEHRSLKTPLLSDLKESGCVNIKCNINTVYKIKNDINIINLHNYYKSIQFTCNKKRYAETLSKSIIKLYKIQKIYLSMQYTFKVKIGSKMKLFITHNHKIFRDFYWKKIFFIFDNSFFTKIKFKNIKYNFIINKIIFYKYSKLYDLNMQNYFNFICNKIILHNSIEQDSDIVMMLYEKDKDENQLENKKILDIVLCKNRNGAIGSFKVVFLPEINLFQNFNVHDKYK